MNYFLNKASMIATVLLVAGCATSSPNGEKLPDNPLENGFAKLSLCDPNGHEIASRNGLGYVCGRALTIQQVDGEAGGMQLMKRDYVYVRPGHHQVLVTGGKTINFNLDVVSGKIYELTLYGKVTVYAKSPELAEYYKKNFDTQYTSGYYREF